MSDEIPSPADRRPVQAEPAERHGLTRLPWESALFETMRELEAQLNICREENVRLRLADTQLKAKLRHAHHLLDNWRLRREAWVRERRELLDRLGRQ